MLELFRRLMRLPEGNPPLPAGDPTTVKVWNPAGGYFRYRVLQLLMGAIPGFVFFFVMGGLGFVLVQSRMKDAPSWALSAVVAVVGLLIVLSAVSTVLRVVAIQIELDLMRYTFTDKAMRLRTGVFHLKEITLSFGNVQNVRLVQGPLQRYFGIADLVVDTAGGGGSVAGQQGAQMAASHNGAIVGVEDADRLRDFILERVRAVKGTGLSSRAGQSRKSEEKAGRRRDAGRSMQYSAVLQEIAKELRETRLRL